MTAHSKLNLERFAPVGCQLKTAEDICGEALAASDTPAASIVPRAQQLVAESISYMRREDAPEFLASVVLSISDQRLKIAFLEELGSHLT